jgi:hypothetical protein
MEKPLNGPFFTGEFARNSEQKHFETGLVLIANLRFGATLSRPVGNRQDSDRLREDSHGELTIGVGPLGSPQILQ